MIYQKHFKQKYVLIVGLLAALFLFIFAFDLFFGTQAQMKFKPYYSGDAIVYRDQVIISSTDTGSLEVFKFSGKDKEIIRFDSAAPVVADNIFTSSILNEERGNLYAYAIDGRYLYKYDVSDLNNLTLAGRVKDNGWDWFLALRRAGGRAATVGRNGVKIWNYDLEVVDGEKNPDKNDELYLSADGRWIFDIKTDYEDNVQNDFIKITDARTGGSILNIPIVLNIKNRHQVHYDSARQLAYITGDRVLKQINLTTGAINNFKHRSSFGYDASGIDGSDHFYFSNGTSILKMTHNLEAADWVDVNKFGIDGSWSMRLIVLMRGGQEKIVVFNNSNIAILNDSLDLLAYYKAVESDSQESPSPREPLALFIDRNRAARNAQVSVRGAGFSPKEEIALVFGRPEIGKMGALDKDIEYSRVVISADDNGRFTKVLTVPEVKLDKYESFPYATDIIAKGLNSGLRYSIGFMIE